MCQTINSSQNLPDPEGTYLVDQAENKVSECLILWNNLLERSTSAEELFNVTRFFALRRSYLGSFCDFSEHLVRIGALILSDRRSDQGVTLNVVPIA